MSKSVNIFALFGIFSIVACVAMAPESIPQQQQDNNNMASSLGCGAVKFMVTTYLPRPHTDSFCSAYLQVPRDNSYTSPAQVSSSNPSSFRDGHSLLPATTQKTFHQATIPQFTWLRERQVQGSPRETLVGKACSCLQTSSSSSIPPIQKNTAAAAVSIVVLPTASIERKENSISTTQQLASSQYQTQLTQANRGNYGSTAVISSPLSEETLPAKLPAFWDPAEEKELRMISKRLGFASKILLDGGVVPVFNESSSDFLFGGNPLGLVSKMLGSS